MRECLEGMGKRDEEVRTGMIDERGKGRRGSDDWGGLIAME